MAVEDAIIEKIDDYRKDLDWRVRENANMGKSFPNLLLQTAGYCLSHYALHRDDLYSGPVAQAHDDGHIHIHDLGMSLCGYCAGWSLEKLLMTGFSGILGGTHAISAPARHFDCALDHIVNFLGSLSNEWAGAQAFSDLDTLLAPYVLADLQREIATSRDVLRSGGLSPEAAGRHAGDLAERALSRSIRQEIQSLIYHLNFDTRWGGQSPFSNFTLDLVPPEDMKSRTAMVAGEPLRLSDGRTVTYGELAPFMSLIDTAIFENLATGDADGQPFTFPVVTCNVTPDFLAGNLPEQTYDAMLECTGKYGSLYFQNCVNGESNKRKINAADSRAMCCRLSLDLNELLRHTGGLFGNGSNTGSIGVVTLSFPLLAREAAAENPSDPLSAFHAKLEQYSALARDALEAKRRYVVDGLHRGLFPYTLRYLFDNDMADDFPTHFSTLGYVGLHDALLNLGIRGGIVDTQGHALAQEILDHMLEIGSRYTRETGHLYNFEGVPAEGAAYRLAYKGVKLFPDLRHSGSVDAPFFTNSCHLPAELQYDIPYVLDHQDELQRRHSGGTVVHLHMDGMLSRNAARRLIAKVAATRIPYFTVSTVVSVCPVHGYIPGDHALCPVCRAQMRRQAAS